MSAEAGTLDEAWAAAEAALPEGWTVASVEGYVADRWTAAAGSPKPEILGPCECCGHVRHAGKREWKFGKGDTPAAALLALAEALRER